MKRNIKKSIISNLFKPWWLISEEKIVYNKILDRIISFCFNHSPKSFRRILASIIIAFGISCSRIFQFLGELSLEMYLLQGREKYSGSPLTVLFIGNQKSFRFLEDILFMQISIRKSIGKMIMGENILYKLKKSSIDCDAVFIKCDVFYTSYWRKKNFTIIPEWISMTLDISGSSEMIYKKLSDGAKDDIRKIKKYSYTYELSEDSDKLYFFYKKMYLPYICMRYGSSAVCVTYFAMRLLFERDNKLMLIKQKDKYLAGSMFSVRNNKITATYTGIKDGNIEYLKQGVGAASYYFLIHWAKQEGIETLNFGTCRPFIDEGVFRYKRKWGATMAKQDGFTSGIIAFKPFNYSNGLKSFLLNNPFVSIDEDKLQITIFKEKNNIYNINYVNKEKLYNDFKIVYLENFLPKQNKYFSED